MSGASYKHYFESIGSTVLESYGPCSTYQVSTAIDNTLHLVDSSPVYRVNWVDNVGVVVPIVTVGDGVQLAAMQIIHQFPATVYKEWAYTNYDVRVATATTSQILYVYAGITSTRAGTSAADPNVLGSFLAATTNTSPAWSVDGQISVGLGNKNEGVEVISEYRSNTEIAIDRAGKPGVAAVVRAQLHIVLLAEYVETTDNAATLYGVQVREYLNDN